MPRAPKAPAYSLHKPSGRAVLKVKGRSYYLGEHGSDVSRENYDRIIADLLAGRTITRPTPTNQGTPTPDCTITVAQLAARFQRHADAYYRKNGKPTTEPATIRCAMKFFTADHGDLPAAAFSIGDLKGVRGIMLTADLCRNTTNKYVSAIRRAFTWAATEELIPPGKSLAQAHKQAGHRVPRAAAPAKSTAAGRTAAAAPPTGKTKKQPATTAKSTAGDAAQPPAVSAAAANGRTTLASYHPASRMATPTGGDRLRPTGAANRTGAALRHGHAEPPTAP